MCRQIPFMKLFTTFVLSACLIIITATATRAQEAVAPGLLLDRPAELNAFYGAAVTRAPDAGEIAINGYVFDPLSDASALPDGMRETIPDARDTRAVVVQFTRPVTRADRAALTERYGLQLGSYLPNNAYLEELTAEQLEQLESFEAFRATIEYAPAFKLSRSIGRVAYRTEERLARAGLFLRIILFDGADLAATRTAIEAFPVSDVQTYDDREIGGVARIQLVLDDTSFLDDISHLAAVQWVEEVGEVIMDDVNAAGTLQSGIAGTRSIWAQNLNGEDQIIGIIDNGVVDINHCFFNDPLVAAAGLNHRKVVSIRNPSGFATTMHGTFVAGLLAGDDFNNPGTNAGRGGAWAARIVSGDNGDLALFGGGSTMLAELTTATNAGAAIHTNSWHENTAGAGVAPDYTQVARDVDTFIWNNENAVVVGSTGNNGEESGPPASAKSAIGVSALRTDPNDNNMCDGNGGPTADGRLKPDIVGPGGGTTVAESLQSATNATACGVALWNPVGATCATSWATPNIAAGVALTRQYFQNGFYPSGVATPFNGFTPSG